MTASRSNKRSAGMISRVTTQRFTHPEQVVARELTTGAVLPQESTDDGTTKCAPDEREVYFSSPELDKLNQLDAIFLVSPEPKSTLEGGNRFSGETRGKRRHFEYGDPFDGRPSDSDDSDISDEEMVRDKKFAKTCAKAVSNCLSRRISRAMIDLIGIEPNPGPKGRIGVNQGTIKSLISSLGLGKSKQGQKKKSKNPQKRSQRQSQKDTLSMQGVPAAYGVVAPRAYFSMGGQAQKLADQDSLNAVRAHGCALLSDGITVCPTVISSVTGALASASDPDHAFLNLTPSSVDPRLNALAQTFQFYAFRQLKLSYIPFVGTETDGGLYVAIGKDADQVNENFDTATPGATGFSGGTPQNVMEYDPSVMTAIWKPAGLSFRHSGTELWQTFPNGEEPTNERIQASVVALFEGPAQTVSMPRTYGHLWLHYEIDFYVPGPPLSSSSGQGGSLFQMSPAVVNRSVPGSGTSFLVAAIPEGDSISGPVLVNASFTLTGGTGGNFQLQATNTTDGLPSVNIGDPVSNNILGSAINMVVPFIMEAGKQWLITLIGAGTGSSATASNIFLKNAY